MFETTRRYPLHLHSSKKHFPEFRLNKHLRQSLFPIRKAFKNNSAVIRCKKDIESVIQKIIPLDFFGCKKNKKLFMNLIKKILNHRKTEFIHISFLSKDYDKTFEWMKCNEAESDETIRNVILYLLEECIKPFIKRHFFPVSQGKSYRIDLIIRDRWQSFRDKIFCQMILKGHVELDKEYKDKVPRGALRILPKENFEKLSYRPVICYFTKSETEENFKRLRQIKMNIKRYVNERKLHSVLHESWESFVNKCGLDIIYGVKADVEDSFGNINITKLSSVIQELPKRVLNDYDKHYIIERIQQQYISFNSIKKRIIVRWSHGLLQGDRLSSILCDLYYLEHIDSRLLQDSLIGNYFFHRTVDDYIFCSTKREYVENFISKLSLGHILNREKICSNVLNDVYVLPYCGYMFNLYTKEVCISFNRNSFDLKHKFKLWNDNLFTSPDYYLTNMMKFSSANFYFSKIIFNTHYNNEESIVKIYFESMVYLAMKFHCSFTELKQYHKYYCENSDIITKKILEIINQYIKKSLKIIMKSKGKLYNADIRSELLLSVGVRAFVLVFHKHFETYKNIIASLKKKIFMKISFFGGLDISFFDKIPSNMKCCRT